MRIPVGQEFARRNFNWAGLLVFAIGLSVRIIGAQSSPPETERFEVAAIRPVTAALARPDIQFTPAGGIRADNVTLKMLIQIAYDIRSDQISGGPGWTDSDLFTVAAKAPRDVSGRAETPQGLTRRRLQNLLKERFHLALKQTESPANGYVLSVDKNGHKMTVANDSQAVSARQTGRWKLQAEAFRMSSFAMFLSVHLKTTVEDQTGLEGGFNFSLNWTPSDVTDGYIPSAWELPEDTLIPAVREQLGLRLDKKKVTADQFTIEHAERPAAN